MKGYKKFKGWMIANDVSQIDAANVIGVTWDTFNRKLNNTGGRDFTIPEVRTLCDRYDLSSDDYFVRI